MPPQDGAGSCRYQLQGEIGRGGMGAILKGRDVDLGRDLAIKVLLESHQGNPEVVRRFVEEAQIGGQLQHPGVVPVYELGNFPDRRPYFAMKLVKGRTLAALLHERRDLAQDLPRFLSIFEQVCQTMAYAHARGVIHRDLKPSNVMVGSFGEVQVMDWGLAKVLPAGGIADEGGSQPVQETIITTVRSGSAGSGSESQAGSVLGTPAYMAPEQARGEVDRIDERADVFGLGGILCEILTGKPPFVGQTREEIRGNAARGDLDDAMHRLDTSAADSELIALARDCLAADRQQRPRDAGIVSTRITAYLTGVQDRLRKAELARVEAQARAEEERKRRRVTVALAASVLLTASVVGGGWFYLARQQQRRAAQVDLALREAELLRNDAERTGDDLTRWLAARDAAQAVVRLVADARDVATRDRVTTLLQQVEQAAKMAQDDEKLLAKLVDIRSTEADDPDGSDSDAAYTDAFREAGIDVDTLLPAEAGASIKSRPASVALALAGALDHWAVVRRIAHPKQEEAWHRLVSVARAADPDPLRDRLRELWSQADSKAQLEALRRLAKEADPETWPVQRLRLMANALGKAGDLGAAVAVLRRTQSRHPAEVWVNFELGHALESARPPQIEEAIRFYSIARALLPPTAHILAHALQNRGEGEEAVAIFQDLVRLRPDNGAHRACYANLLKERGNDKAAQVENDRAIADLQALNRLKPGRPVVHSNLGLALLAQGRLDEAIAECRTAIRLKPDLFVAHGNLGLALLDQGRLDEAIAECRTAIDLKPDYANAHGNLGNALRDQGRLEEAIAEYRAAIRLNPDYAQAHSNLGEALRARGKLAEAIAECREAIRLKPDYSEAHSGLGLALGDQGTSEEAIAECREAIRLKPDSAQAHTNLGAVLGDQGKLEEAIAECREAIRLKPNSPDAHSNLGSALWGQGKLAEAITELREAIRLRPDHSGAHCNLGLALIAQGKPEEAIAEFAKPPASTPTIPTSTPTSARLSIVWGNWRRR